MTTPLKATIALDGEPLIDRRGGDTKVRIGDGVTPGGNPMATGSIGGVVTPTITSHNGTEGAPATVTLVPQFTSDAFYGVTIDVESDTHAASYWQIATDAAFTNLVVNTGYDTVNLTDLDLDTLGSP